MNPKAPHKRTLEDLQKGDSAVIEEVSCPNKTLSSKLLSMGLVHGTRIEVIGVAPLGDPIEVRARGYTLSLRRSEAQGVHVQ
jgi:ferrous iron transport protein A